MNIRIDPDPDEPNGLSYLYVSIEMPFNPELQEEDFLKSLEAQIGDLLSGQANVMQEGIICSIAMEDLLDKMEDLDVQESLILYLHFFEGIPIEEIAQLMGWTSLHASVVHEYGLIHMAEKICKKEEVHNAAHSKV